MRKVFSLPLRSKDDPEAMTEAIDVFLKQNLVVIRPARYQLKSGKLDYYPNTGRVMIDGERARRERGLDALQKAIDERPLAVIYRIAPDFLRGISSD